MSGNYPGIQPNNTAYIKQFSYGVPSNLWYLKTYANINNGIKPVITPNTNISKDLYIPGNLYIDGNIYKPSDSVLKQNITKLNIETCKLMNLNPVSFEFIDDIDNTTHYGFVADEFENEYPELVNIKPDKTYSSIKGIDYLELVPLLVCKIQQMQKEIDDLKNKFETNI